METPIRDALREALAASSQEPSSSSSSSSSFSPSPSPSSSSSSSSSTNYPSESSPSNQLSALENMNLNSSPSISRSLHHNQPIMNPPPTPTTPTPPAYPTEDSQSTCSDSSSSNSTSTSSSSSTTSEGQESTATITVEEAEKKFTAVEISAKPKTWKEHFNSLPPRTRQTVRTLAIALVSGLALVAIFHLARLAEHPTNTNELDGEASKVSAEVVNDPHISSSVFKAENGKAVEYKGSDKQPARDAGKPWNPVEDHRRRLGPSTEIHPILGVPVPVKSHSDVPLLKSLQRRKNRPANETEIQKTLQMVRKKVEANRKLLTKKELQLWSTGEVPLRVLLVTTWRSGSTFLGQVLASHPGVYHHYEPLSFKGVRQIRSGRDAFETQQLLHRLLECRYEGLADYLKYSKKKPEDMMGHNKLVWGECNVGPNVNVCFNETFLNQACNMFPIQLVKTVRLRLNLTQLFLNDKKMNVKVVFLVRDPRAIMSSRYTSVGWCKNSTDCSSPEVLCQDLQGDLKVATAFKHLYPDRFTMIKYENLAQDPQKEIQKLMEFLGMEYSRNIDKFVVDHTQVDLDQPWSTKRKSSDRISLWKKQLPLQEVFAIQNVCESPIKTLSYELMGQ